MTVSACIANNKRCSFSSNVQSSLIGLTCSDCGHTVRVGMYALLGTPKNLHESPGFYFFDSINTLAQPNQIGHPGKVAFEIRTVHQSSPRYTLDNGYHYLAEWVVESYHNKPASPVDYSLCVVPDVAGPQGVNPTAASNMVQNVVLGGVVANAVGGMKIVPMPVAAVRVAAVPMLTCTCVSLLQGHNTACGYAAQQKVKHRQEGKYWR